MSLACPDGRCALPATPCWARTAVPAVGSALAQAHWSLPQGRCQRGPLINGPGRIPPYCVCSGGADTVTGGAAHHLRLGPSPSFFVGPLRSAPPFAVWFLVVGFPSLLGGVGWWWWGGRLLAIPGRVACVRVSASPGCGSPPVAAGGPRPLLAGPGRRSPPLLAAACGGQFRGVWWGVSCVACVCGAARAGVCVVCLWRLCGCGCVFRVCWRVCGVWRFISLAWPCCWCRCWCGCGWCVLWALPRHSWRRFLRAFSRHSWLGFAAGGGEYSSSLLAEGLGCGPFPLLAGVRRRRWCVVACHSWVSSWLRFPAIPGWGLPAAAVAVSVGLGGGYLVVCVFVARCVRAWCLCWCVCRVLVVVAWVWVCLPCVLVCVCVCGWVCGWGRLGLSAGVGVGVVGVCRGWSLAIPGGGF